MFYFYCVYKNCIPVLDTAILIIYPQDHEITKLTNITITTMTNLIKSTYNEIYRCVGYKHPVMALNGLMI